jgi:B-box zinc finger protein
MSNYVTAPCIVCGTSTTFICGECGEHVCENCQERHTLEHKIVPIRPRSDRKADTDLLVSDQYTRHSSVRGVA